MTIEYLSSTIYEYLESYNSDKLKAAMISSIKESKNSRDLKAINYFFDTGASVGLSTYKTK